MLKEIRKEERERVSRWFLEAQEEFVAKEPVAAVACGSPQRSSAVLAIVRHRTQPGGSLLSSTPFETNSSRAETALAFLAAKRSTRLTSGHAIRCNPYRFESEKPIPELNREN